MAEFNPAFEHMIRNEGGFKLTNVAADRGGQTYAGIARNFHPSWPGWRFIDTQRLDAVELTGLVRDFYKAQFWDRVAGDEIKQQAVAESIFDFAVNAGVATSAKLAQIVAGVLPDGAIGPKSLAALNKIDESDFALAFALAKIKRYAEICNRSHEQCKFLLGWINRTLGALT